MYSLPCSYRWIICQVIQVRHKPTDDILAMKVTDHELLIL
jgi:hypothetical protein